MFLTKTDNLKWKWLAIATVITLGLCLLGVAWFDKPLYMAMRHLNWIGWGAVDTIFSTEVWLMTSLGFAVGFFIGNTIRESAHRQKSKTKLGFRGTIVKFIDGSRHNYGLLVFSSVFVATCVAAVLKIVLGRARPIFFEALGQTGFYPFTTDWAFHSMPSGHGTASFAGLVMIGLLFPRIKWATWTIAIIIGVSRVSYGVHWPTDVILAAFIGMVSADVVKYLFAHYGKDK